MKATHASPTLDLRWRRWRKSTRISRYLQLIQLPQDSPIYNSHETAAKNERAGRPKAKDFTLLLEIAMICCALGPNAVFLKKEVNPVILTLHIIVNFRHQQGYSCSTIHSETKSADWALLNWCETVALLQWKLVPESWLGVLTRRAYVHVVLVTLGV